MKKGSVYKIKRSYEDVLVDLFIYVVCIFVFIATIYPFLNVLAISLNDPVDTIRGGIYLLPRKFTTFTYQQILKDPMIYSAAMTSIARTVIGSVSAIFCTVLVAYSLSRKEFVLRKLLTTMMIMTMYIGGGMIPFYFLLRSLGLINNFGVYIIPSLVGPFNVIIVRTYIQGLPGSFIESAKIDGATEWQVIYRIIFPLIIPVVATIALFISVGQWNNWFDTYLYAPSRDSLSTLQYELMKKLATATLNTSATLNDSMVAGQSGGVQQVVTPQSVRAAMTMIVSLPIICVYPFLQKYFVGGLRMGGVKE